MEVITTSPGGRKQLQLHVAREAGSVRKLRIQRVPTTGDRSRLETVLELDREQSTRLLDMLKALNNIPIEGDHSVYVDDQLLRDVFEDPGAVSRIYARSPERFRAVIEEDAQARDVIALQRRRDVVAMIRDWLESDASFAEAAAEAGGPERAWQSLLEDNPWILGIGLGGQFLTSWDQARLEQTVAGRNVAGVGKRVDALLATSGLIRSMVFAEIKHHQTDLLADEYRAGAYRPSNELMGAIVQVQQTVHLACVSLGDYLQGVSDAGEMDASGTFLLKPRSFVVAGSLEQLTGENGGPLRDRFRSFELFRRNLHDPEVITFDEVLARAEWNIAEAERTQG